MTDHEKSALFAQAVQLRNSGDHESALPILLRLAEADPDSHPEVFMLLGDTQEELGYVDLAVASFRTAVRISPTSERASRLLFACLWDRADDDGESEAQALDEIRRFVTLTESDA